jgi:hypothetical protein
MLHSKLTSVKIIDVVKKYELILLILVFSSGTAIADTSDRSSNIGPPPLEAGFIGSNAVYLTEAGEPKINNDLSFYIKSVSNPLVTDEKALKKSGNKAYIKLFFDYGDGLGDLASKQDASSFILSPVRLYG